MNSYVYAPKDDSKHRANWRDLYTVEEADHLTSLIAAADECGITFYYALSPGLDMAYSSTKDVSALKRKLEQASQLGCTAFALLFDDIDPEMSEADKEVFQSFAHAQVSECDYYLVKIRKLSASYFFLRIEWNEMIFVVLRYTFRVRICFC